MVFGFLKTRPVKFSKNEEVEISIKREIENLPLIFITKVLNQSQKKISFVLPPEKSRRETIKPQTSILVHFVRESNLGSFQCKVIDVMEDEIPPYFSVDCESGVFWEEIIPSKITLKDTPSDRGSLTVDCKYKKTIFSAAVKRADEKDFVFSSEKELPVGGSLIMTLRLPDIRIDFVAEVRDCIPSGDIFETVIDFSFLDTDVRRKVLDFLSST